MPPVYSGTQAEGIKSLRSPVDIEIMWNARNPINFLGSDPLSNRTNKRRHGRLKCDLLTCALGEVMDFSASGMKVRYRGRLQVERGQVVDMALHAAGSTQNVKARVVHIHKAGFRRHDLGLEFVEVTPEVSKGLLALARIAMDSMTLGHEGCASSRHQ
jgi:hypothetical protein